MLQSSIAALIDLATIIISVDQNAAPPTNQTYFEISSAWKRTKSYRDRVLGVYFEVLAHIYQEQRQITVAPLDSKASSQLTPFGNNRVSGDIGNLSGVTPQSQADGRRLMNLLGQILTHLNQLEGHGKALLNTNGRFVPHDVWTEKLKQSAKVLKDSSKELLDLLPQLGGAGFENMDGGDPEDGDYDSDEDITMDTVRRQLEIHGGGSTLGAVKAAAGSFVGMLDPPLHASIFCFDVLRGSLLARYKGAEQLWIRRPQGGRIDAICIPARDHDPAQGRNKKALLYCNPNAGLIEVAAGMSLAGGNVGDGEMSDACWTDYYTARGFDVYLFNYAGFGRSHGTNTPANKTRKPGAFAATVRIFNGAFIDFKPTPESLKADAFSVGKHIISQLGVDSLTIHGESIGGMAAAGAARALTQMPETRDKVRLLICDRTFCNLHAIAQRLVGGWTGPAIEGLAPFWNTDVAGDFLGASCPKIVANDSADAIIADAGCLKAGIALWKEVRRESSTSKIAWKMDAPLEYKMADYEEVGVRESRISPTTNSLINAPRWPADKHLSARELFHFAACARRIGKLATIEKRNGRSRLDSLDEEHGLELTVEGLPTSPSNDAGPSALLLAWRSMSACDGLCGSTLGKAVSSGYDWTFTWLACTLTFGGQTIVKAAEQRLRSALAAGHAVLPIDFDSRPPGYELDESDTMIHPKPFPDVIATLQSLLDSSKDGSLGIVDHELRYCIGMFQYVMARLSAPQSVADFRRGIHFQDNVGHFLNLHCGHNNQFSAEEKLKLGKLLEEVDTSERGESII